MNQSLKKAFEILSFIMDHPQKLSLNTMAKALDMNKTTLFRLLTTLENLGILGRSEDRYVPGIKLYEWGSKVPVKDLIIDRCHPILKRLAEEINETVNLGELNGNRVLYLHKTESKRSLQIRFDIGSYISVHCSGLGKAVLSTLPEPQRQKIISQLEYEKRTPHTITNAEILKKQLDEVCQRGYSTDLEELEEGLHCVSVPLIIPSLHFHGAISSSGPSVRFSQQRMEQLALRLKEAVKEIQMQFS